jgi:predicted TIM-barrel fold metal-dependent hydrolase
MTLIDSHFHVNYLGFSLTDTIKYLDRERIDCCWLLSWEEINPGPWVYYYLPVEDIYEAYLKYPSRIIPFYAPDPHRSDAIIQLQNWYQKGIRGCGELKATLSWDSEQVTAILKTSGRLRMPIVFHMEASEGRDIPYFDAPYNWLVFWGLRTNNKIYSILLRILQVMVNNFAPLRNRTKSYFFPGYMLDFAALEVALGDYPDVNFVAHGPMFWKYMSAEAATSKEILSKGSGNGDGIIWRLLRDYPNLYADTSGSSGLTALTRNSATTKRFLSMFEDKILYGTDNFMKEQKEFLESLALPEGVYKKIYGDNAYRLLNR